MAERTIVVCDVCGKPATETVTIKVARGNYAKDLCAAHVTELVAGARRPRPGRPRKMAGETSGRHPEASRPSTEDGWAEEHGPEAQRGQREGSGLRFDRAFGQEVDALRLLHHDPFAKQRTKRRLHLPADVGLREGIEVAAAQREVLDPGPVQGRRLLGENGEDGGTRLHHAPRVAAITRSAKSSTWSGSWIAKGRTQGDTMSSRTPSDSNAATRSRIWSGVPERVSARQVP